MSQVIRSRSGASPVKEQVADRADQMLRPAPDEAEPATALVARIDGLLEGHRSGRLVGPDGDSTEIPASVLAGLRKVASAIAQGQAVTVAPQDLELTTQEAADLLHVSRPHLIKLLDRGDLPHHRTSDDPAAHRRVLLRDAVEFRNRRRQSRREALRKLTEASQELEDDYS